jgi:hypothetical protein
MPFLAPLALLFGLLSVPIVILYMLKLRRREVEISSTLLWRVLLRDREANAPWQRLKRNLLLLLQLLLLVALVLALARPFWNVPTVASGTVVVLLDGSASMTAADVTPTRFEAARVAVRQLIEGLSADGRLTLILAGQQPEVLASATSDKDALLEALSRARPGATPADWESALALAAGAVRAGDVARSTVVIVSDGGLPTSGLPPVAGQVRYVPIGQSADNLAISALALRPTANGTQLFASVANYGDQARDVIVSVKVNGDLFTAQKLTVLPGQTAPFVISGLAAGAAAYEARLSPPPPAQAGDPLDALPLDDVAYAAYQPPTAGRALVVSPGNTFLDQVLTALSKPFGLEPYRLHIGEPIPDPKTDAFDLYVLDSYTGTLPAGDLFLINPISSTLFSVGASFTNTILYRVTDDLLAQNIEWGNVHLRQARRVFAPDWARIIVDSEGGPLVFAGETQGRRVAVIAFDLHDTDLPLQITFPILMANLLNYLAPAQAFSAPNGLRPGETLSIRPGAGDTTIAITDPNGQSYTAPAATSVLFANTETLGFYSVKSNQRALGVFAVNLFNPTESNIRPAASVRVGQSAITAAAREELGQYEIWPWLAGLGLLVLFIEWWVYQRGTTLPALAGWRGWFQRKKV